jgi:hypothetical protein
MVRNGKGKGSNDRIPGIMPRFVVHPGGEPHDVKGERTTTAGLPRNPVADLLGFRTREHERRFPSLDHLNVLFQRGRMAGVGAPVSI